MRSFIAVELPSPIIEEVFSISQAIRVESRYISWVQPSAFHLTLRFLGDISLDKISQIEKGLDECADYIPSFNLRIEGLGAFPNISHPRVIWTGILGEIDRFCSLKGKIDDLLLPLGFAPEPRSFTPHLTLARVKNEISLLDKESLRQNVLKKEGKASGQFKVEFISLMESRLTPKGAKYNSLYQAPLRGTA
jgi:2'-5' RNA ligase